MAGPPSASGDQPAGGVSFWLVDDFVDLLGAEPIHFSRQVRKITSPDGLARSSNFDIDFDPTYQRLVVHHIRVVRGETTIELATPERFEVLRRERDLERAHYDGRLTAHAILPDLRVGDVVDSCFSVIGANPALKGRICFSAQFQWSQRVGRCRYRIFAPAARKLSFHTWGQEPAYAETQLKQGNVLHAWTADDFPVLETEQLTPPWWIGYSRVLISDVVDWAEVADMFRASYAGPPFLPDDLEAQVRELEASCGTPAERIAAALKLIQRDVRYLAISVGEGGFTPRAVDEIWRTRFGDCKDKSRLLTAVLARLGVDAAPVLVNTSIGRDLKDWPPGVALFDHCVVRVRSGGATYWLDATRPVQGGRLDRLVQVRFGWALPLEAGAELEWMGEDAVETFYEHREHVTLGPRRQSTAELEVRRVYRGWRADDLRRRLANEGDAALARGFRSYFENVYGALDVQGDPAIEDLEPDNEIRVSDRYLLKEPWRLTDDGAKAWFRVNDDTFRSHLVAPEGPSRNAPVHLGAPRGVLQSFTLDLPRAWTVKTFDERWEVGGVTARSRRELTEQGRRLLLESTLQVRERVLGPEQAVLLRQNLERINGTAGVTLTHTLRNGEFSPPQGKSARSSGFFSNPWRIVWLVFVVLYLARMLVSH